MRGDAIETFKYLRGFLEVDQASLLTTSITSEPQTRHQHSFMPLTVPCANIDLQKNFFTVRSYVMEKM